MAFQLRTCALCAWISAAVFAVPGAGLADITTYHYDNYRTGWESNETMLTPANVASASFGILFTTTLRGHGPLVGQPLIVGQVTFPNIGTHRVVYLAGDGDDVWALDANSGAVLNHAILGTPVPASANPANNVVGIRSAPVIDESTNTLYVMADAYVNSTPTYVLHALDLATLQDKIPPVTVAASTTLSDGSTINFNAEFQQQHTALLLSNGNLYAGFGSFGDVAAQESRGWLLGWNAATLAPLSAVVLTNHLATNSAACAKASPCFLSSIWMSGAGIASDDAAGVVFAVTGNSGAGTYSSSVNLSESALQISDDLSTLEDFFTPNAVDKLDAHDRDFGSGGITLLPTQPGSVPHLAVAAGKAGTMYLLNRNDMGGYSTTSDKVEAHVVIGSCWCSQSYFQGSDGIGRIVSGGGTSVGIWQVQTSPHSNTRPKLVQQSASASLPSGQDPGLLTTVSSNGTTAGTAIIWTVTRPTSPGGQTTLYALDGLTASTLFSTNVGAWPTANNNATITPAVNSGRVYLAVWDTLVVLGLGATGHVKIPAASAAVPRVSGHEIYGTVVKADGTLIYLRLRDGRVILVDNSIADARDRTVDVYAGSALGVDGNYDSRGLYRATLTFRAKQSPAMWLPDK